MTPGTLLSCTSSGVATAEAIVSALAPGRLAAHLDGGKIHLRQRRDRQQRKGNEPQQHRRHREQHGGNGVMNEPVGKTRLEVHRYSVTWTPPCGVSWSPSAVSFEATFTAVPAMSWAWPSVTTRSPGSSPAAMVVTAPCA